MFRRFFWFGLGAGAGSYVTRKLTVLRSNYTWRSAAGQLGRAGIAALPGVLDSLRKLLYQAVNGLRTVKDQTN